MPDIELSFAVGDRVFHPAHGAGLVVAIERPELHEEFNRYYAIQLVAPPMRVLVPVRTAESIGLRAVAARADAEAALESLATAADALPDDFKARQAAIGDRLRTGDLGILVTLVRDLAGRGRDRVFSPTEARLFEQARVMLCGELALAFDVSVEDIGREVEVRLNAE
ncbi:MAG: CarD family transcriptional regulator [Ardenticatenales bacterium]